MVAGRTDAGVHARGQVAHLDVDEESFAALPGRSTRTPTESLVQRLAGVLPHDVVVSRAQVVPETFDARFSATGRRYRYRIADSPHRPDPLLRRHVAWVKTPIDEQAMAAAAVPLLGRHDFVAFCRPRTGASTVRTLRRVDVTRSSGLVVVEVAADAFCHHQVRAMAGALIDVGSRRRDAQWLADVLAAGKRDGAVHVAPAHGLTLEAVAYPDQGDYGAQAERARARRSEPR